VKHLVATAWALYGESGVPFWLVLPLAAVAVYLLVRWIRHERRKACVASRLLPYTGSILLVMAAWLLWKPALVRIDTWEHPSEVVALVDDSRSMDVPLVADDLSARLEALELWEPEAVNGRRAAARDLARSLHEFAERAGGMRAALRTALDDVEQGMPPGADAGKMLADHLARLRQFREQVYRAADAVRDDATSMNGEGKPMPQDIEEPLAAMLDALSRLTRIPDSFASEDLAARLAAIEEIAAHADALSEPLGNLQAVLDAEFLAKHRGELEPRLREITRMTRLDAARRLAGALPAARVVPASERGIGRGQTDLHRAISDLLDARETHSISDLVIFSDGGQNAPWNPELPARLRKSCLRVTVVGTGYPQPHDDLAILDWRVPGILRAKQPAALRVLLKTRRGASHLPSDGRGGRGFRSDCVTPEQSSPEPITVAFTVAGEQAEGRAIPAERATEQWVDIPFTAPDTDGGSNRACMATIQIKTPNANTDNDRVAFPMNVVKVTPKALLIAYEPDWDTTYVYLAMLACGLDAQQIHYGLSKDPPRRGGTRHAIPKAASQWSRYRAVVLRGAAFRGFNADDARALFDYVTVQGGSLVVFANGGESYLAVLAGLFGWNQPPTKPIDTPLVLAPEAMHLPVMRLSTDGPASARLLAGLGPCSGQTVPRQHVPLLCTPDGRPLLSLGFYGRGKVYLCGIRELHRLSEYANAEIVARLLEQLMADAATPMFADDGEQLAAYSGKLAAIDNPGLEQIRYEFDEDFLKNLARESGGSYATLEQAREKLPALKPEPWRSSTASRYVLADHWVLLVLLAFTGSAHWVLRKLAGLAI